jgi:hypothetical protein
MRPGNICGLVVAVLLFAVQVEQSPHLVHHLFEDGPSTETCALAAAPDRLPGIEHSPALPGPDLTAHALLPADHAAGVVVAGIPTASPRAPPAAS